MTNEELIAFATARHGAEWKGRLSDETGWSWWTFYRIEKGTHPVSKKLEQAIRSLKPERS